MPKVDLHVHLEGTITPDMVQKLANKNGIDVPYKLFDERTTNFQWINDDNTPAGALRGFLQAYDLATSVLRGAADYEMITYDFLVRCAKEGCIYAEIIISPDHGKMAGLSYSEMVAAVASGYERARCETGIEARFISTFVRQFGIDAALAVARDIHANPHPLVTGLGLAGDENFGTFQDFKPAFDIAGLKSISVHAGEAAGSESIRAARDFLGVRRFGHMLQAAYDGDLLQEQLALNAIPEICVSSNMALRIFSSLTDHPFRKFVDLGLKVVLGSDDPSFFRTSIGKEYEIAHSEFGLSVTQLFRITCNAIEEAFLDDETRSQLMATAISRFV